VNDAELRALERRWRETGDEELRYRWRCELVRIGRGEEAGLQEGDLVEVLEDRTTSYYTASPWRATLRNYDGHSSQQLIEWLPFAGLCVDGSKTDDYGMSIRNNTSGLLRRRDKVTLLEPAPPKQFAVP